MYKLLPEEDEEEKPAPRRRFSFRGYLAIIGLMLTVAGTMYGLYRYSVWSDTWSLRFQSPIQNFIRIEPRASKKPAGSTARKVPQTFEEKIRDAFGTHADTFIKIARAESGHNAGAKGYNCFYYNAKGERYSTACKPEDRGKAWSVDCGALQVNVYGQKCPDELYDLDVNLKAAVGKFQRQGFGAWSVCTQKKITCV